MKYAKIVLAFLLDKDCWLATLIQGVFVTAFWFSSIFIMLVATIQPWWSKLTLIPLLATALYILCRIVERCIYKMLNMKQPGIQ